MNDKKVGLSDTMKAKTEPKTFKRNPIPGTKITINITNPRMMGFFPPALLPVNLFIVSCNFLIASSKLGGVGPLLKPPPFPPLPPLPGGVPHGL